MKKLIRISASDYTPHLIKVSPADKKYILDKLNKSHKTLGDLGSAGDPGYYVSEFEDAAYGLWSSDKGLKILNDAGIAYEEVKKAVTSSYNPFYDKLSDYDKRIVDSQLRSKYPYQIVSMAAILRDHIDLVDKAYKDDTHKKLTDIADSLYNVGLDPADMYPEYSQLYARMGKEYFDKVLDDMYAIDSQLTSDDKVQELVDDYYDRIGNITASTKVTAATNYDTKLIAKWLKAKFDDEAFGTAYTMHRISDADAYMGRNGLTYNRKNNTIDLWKSGGDEDIPIYKVIPQYSSTKRQGTYAPKMPKLVPIDEWNATHGVTASTKVTAMGGFSPDTFDVYNALLPYIGEYSSNTGWTGSCELMKVKNNNTADGYLYKVIWDDGHDIDVFSWQINDNPRIGGDFTLMVMPAHGMPDFCDSEKDFYRSVRKVFGGGLKKIN